MTTTVSRLANGMRVVSHSMPHLGTVALGVWVGSGARHEKPEEHGISHFLEHMAFKGTARRTAQQIAEEIEQVGGELNAATSLDTTYYYARVLKDDLGLAIDLLADILQNPLYSEEEIEREREVVLQEIAATRDSPDDVVYDLVQDAAFTAQPLGRTIIGTPASVARFTAADLRAFLAARYRASDIVLSAAGHVDHGELVRHAEAVFSGLNRGSSSAAEHARYVGGSRVSKKPFEQAHVILGYEALSYRDAQFYAAQVLSGLFGGGMSSRLFQEVREKRGLCYSIYSSVWGLSDSGLCVVHAATGPELMSGLVEVVQEQFARTAAELPTEREVQRAKAQMKTGLLMSLESSVARAEQMARQMLAFDRLLPAAELIEKVEAVTPAAVRDTAQRIVGGSRLVFALAGAGETSERIASRAMETLHG